MPINKYYSTVKEGTWLRWCHRNVKSRTTSNECSANIASVDVGSFSRHNSSLLVTVVILHKPKPTLLRCFTFLFELHLRMLSTLNVKPKFQLRFSINCPSHKMHKLHFISVLFEYHDTHIIIEQDSITYGTQH